jgi:prevent-host-death family protein
MEIYTTAEARRRLPELIDRAGKGEAVGITRRGKDVAVLVDPEFFYSAIAAIPGCARAGRCARLTATRATRSR